MTLFRNNAVSNKIDSVLTTTKLFFHNVSIDDIFTTVCLFICAIIVSVVVGLPSVNMYYGKLYADDVPLAELVGIENIIVAKNNKLTSLQIIGYDYKYSPEPVIHTINDDIKQIFLIDDRITHIFTENWRYTVKGYIPITDGEHIEILSNQKTGEEYLVKDGECSSIIEKIKIRK